MSLVGQFLDDPIRFASSGVLVVLYSDTRNMPEVYDFTILANNYPMRGGSAYKAYNGDGVEVPIYTICKPADGERTFKAHWCPYQKDGVKSTVVTKEADFMFTAKMDGCSFGVGSATPEGDRLVSHANYASGGATGTQRSGQFDMLMTLRSPGDKEYKVLSPSMYKFGNMQATTFGVRSRTTGKWDFYFHTYSVDVTAKRFDPVGTFEIV